MSYEKTNWVDKTPTNSGTPVNADNLNKIEQGIENATLHAEQNEASIKDLRQNTANAIIGTASGQAVTLSDVQEGTSARSLKIYGEATEVGEGEKSPDNPYELQGVENPVVRVHGKNLFYAVSGRTSANHGMTRTYDLQNQTMTINGTATQEAGHGSVLMTNFKFKAGKSYKLRAFVISGTGGQTVTVSKKDGTTSSIVLSASKNYIATYTPEVDSVEDVTAGFYWYNGTTADNLTVKLMISEVDVDEYEPYKPIIDYPATTPTLYSLPNGVADEVDLVTGKGTKRLMELRLDGSELWSPYSDRSSVYIGFYTTPYPVIGTESDTLGPMITRANWLPFSTLSVHNQTGNAFWVHDDGIVYVSIERSVIGATPEETPTSAIPKWKAFLATQPLIILAERTTHEPFEIDPLTIPTYSPTTIISTDQGSLEVEYNRDINSALTESGLDPAMFVPRVNQANRVYTTSPTGQQETKPISDFATPSYVDNNISKFYKGEVLNANLDNASEDGIYEVVSSVSGVFNGWLWVSSLYVSGTLRFRRQLFLSPLANSLQQRVWDSSYATWLPWENYAYMSDLDDKLDKTNTANILYGTDATGNQKEYPIDTSNPSALASKEYVDNLMQAHIDQYHS